VLSLQLATVRSVILSLLKSPVTIELGKLPVAYAVYGANVNF